MTIRAVGSAHDLGKATAARRAALAAAEQDAARVEPDGLLDGVVHLIYGNRQHGKTGLAEQWLALAPEPGTRVLLVMGEDLAAITRSHLGLSTRDRSVRSWRPYLQGTRDLEPGVEYAVDDVQEFVREALGSRVLPHLLTVCTATDQQVARA